MDSYEITKELGEIASKIAKLEAAMNPEKMEKRVEEIHEKSLEPDFWNDENSKHLLKEKTSLESKLAEIRSLKSDADDLLELVDMGEGLEKEIEAGFAEVAKRYENLETTELLSGEHDAQNAILSVHAGSGGTEAMDWADMLLRMYLRYAEQKRFRVEMLDKNDDTVAGIKSATIRVTGENAYGYLKNEQGVHRLVRISPFDSNKRRHTSFAAVDVVPEIEDIGEVEIDPKDIRVDTFRSSGAGGQHVNKTDSAIRITHIPTKIVVSVQNERSQHQNKDTAMRILISKLTKLAEEEHKENLAELQGDYNEITWGSQIRSYVFQPYTMVKDHRTGAETSAVEKVMDGDIDIFINEKLRQTR